MFQHPLINQPPGLLRKVARDQIRGKFIGLTLACLLFLALTQVLPMAFTFFLPLGQISHKVPELGITVRYSLAANFYKTFMQGAFSAGLAHLLLLLFRERRLEPLALFDGFGFYLKCLALDIYIMLVTTIGLIAFLVPGLMFYYRYSQAYFILAEHPEKRVGQCLAESAFLMDGNKFNLFKLDLTYLVYFLPYIGLIAGYSYFNLQGQVPVSFLFYCAAALACAPALASQQAGRTVFFEMLTGRMTIQTGGQPLQSPQPPQPPQSPQQRGGFH